MAHAVHQALIGHQGIAGIQSPSSVPVALPRERGIALERLWLDEEPNPDLPSLAKRALADPMWVGTLVSEDASVGSIVVHVLDSRSETMEGVVDIVESVLEPFRSRGFEYHLAGHPIESVVAGRDLASSTNALTPFTAIIIAAVVFWLTRSWQAVLVAMVAMGVSLTWTFGALGWLGWPQDSVLQVLAPLILIVGVCDAIHLLSRYGSYSSLAAGGAGRLDAVDAAVLDVAAPCVVTTITTAGAFLSFLTSDLATFGRFGMISAFGVVACLLVTFTLVPALLVMLPQPTKKARSISRSWSTSLGAVARTAQNRAGAIISLTALSFAVLGYGWVAYLEVDTDPTTMWGDQNRVTRWIRFVDTRLRGLDSLEIKVSLPPSNQLEDPATLNQLSAFSDFLEGTEGLGRATSVATVVSRANRLIHGDDPQFERSGDTIRENAEILMTVELSASELLDPWLSLDRSSFRVSVEGPSDSAKGRGRVLDEVRRYISEELPAEWKVNLTGPFSMEFDWVTQMQDTQLRSFGAAFLIVLTCVTVFFRSFSLGLVAMIPAVTPVVTTLGFMGFAGLNLDVGRVMLAAIVIGIGVDDGVHLLQHYARQRRLGMEAHLAARSSVMEVGRAVVITSAALGLGFLTLMTSAWQSISSFGFFVTVAITGALAGALLVVPAVLSARVSPIRLDEHSGQPLDGTPRGDRGGDHKRTNSDG